jgi:hypothetical protein
MAMSVAYATVHDRLVEENRGGLKTEQVWDKPSGVVTLSDTCGRPPHYDDVYYFRTPAFASARGTVQIVR